MVSVSGAVGTALKAVAFSALNKFDTLNAIVNKLSGGSVNRDTLAQSVLRGAINLGSQYAVEKKLLGERSAELVPALREIAVDNDIDRMKAGVQKLLTTLLGETAGGWVAGPAQSLAEAWVGDHAVEKLLATHVAQHGWTPIEDLLNNALGGVTGGKFIAGQVKAIIERAMARPEYNASDKAEFRLMAGLMREALIGSDNYIKPLRAYAPTIVPMAESAVKNLKDGVDQVAQKLSGPPVSQDMRSAFREQIEKAAKDFETRRQKAVEQGKDPRQVEAPVVKLTAGKLHEDTTDRDVAQTLVQGKAIAEGLGVQAPSTEEVQQEVDKALDKGYISGERHQEISTVVDKLSDEQLLPLGERGGIQVAHTATGRLDRVEAQSHKITALREELDQAMREALARAPDDTGQINQYVVGKGYAEHAGSLSLKLPESEYGYTDTALESGRTLWNLGRWALGYEAETHARGTEVRQLYNTCGQDEGMLQAVSRFLDPEVARAALVGPTLEQMRDPDSGLVRSGEVFLKLQDEGHPRFSFEVQKVSSETVTVFLEATWDIAGYGADPQKLRTPEGSTPSAMSSTCAISVRKDPEGGPPKLEFIPMGVLASVNNEIQFDLSTGRMQQGSGHEG